MSEWISLKDKNPPFHKPILVTDGQIIEISRYLPGNQLNGIPWNYFESLSTLKNFPSHWMNLPELPNE